MGVSGNRLVPVWMTRLPTRSLTDAAELAVSTIMEQPDDSGAFHPAAFESQAGRARPARSYLAHLCLMLSPARANWLGAPQS